MYTVKEAFLIKRALKFMLEKDEVFIKHAAMKDKLSEEIEKLSYFPNKFKDLDYMGKLENAIKNFQGGWKKTEGPKIAEITKYGGYLSKLKDVLSKTVKPKPPILKSQYDGLRKAIYDAEEKFHKKVASN